MYLDKNPWQDHHSEYYDYFNTPVRYVFPPPGLPVSLLPHRCSLFRELRFPISAGIGPGQWNQRNTRGRETDWFVVCTSISGAFCNRFFLRITLIGPRSSPGRKRYSPKTRRLELNETHQWVHCKKDLAPRVSTIFRAPLGDTLCHQTSELFGAKSDCIAR